MRAQTAIVFLLAVVWTKPHGQTALNDAGFQAWLSQKADFVLFDTRGDAHIDSIIYPCFYVSEADAKRLVDSLGCKRRLLIYCHKGISAHLTAQAMVAAGYPADSVFSSGFEVITTSRFSAADTLPVAMLNGAVPVPADLSPFQLRAIQVSGRPHKLIDIRTVSEIAGGLIPGACNIVWPDPFQAQGIRFSKSELIILNCKSGNRAGSARSHLVSLGFDSANVINFGGFSKWESTGMVVSGSASSACACVGILNHAFASPKSPEIHQAARVQVRGNSLLIVALPFDGIADAAIFDVFGREVRRWQGVSEGRRLGLNGIPAGIYILNLQSDHRAYRLRLNYLRY